MQKKKNKVSNLEFLPEEIKDACKNFLNRNDVFAPSPIEKFTGNSEHRVMHLACGNKHIIVVTRKFEAFSWGDNSCGQLGLGKAKEKYVANPTYI